MRGVSVVAESSFVDFEKGIAIFGTGMILAVLTFAIKFAILILEHKNGTQDFGIFLA